MRRVGAALAIVLALVVAARAAAPVEVGRFEPGSEPGAPPTGWEALTFQKTPKHTRYTLVREGEEWVIRAESEAAASGLYRPLDLDARVYRVLTWRWKVEHVLAAADARRREGDDYAARVYVAFRYEPDTATLWERARYGAFRLLYGRYPPKVALNYVWDNRLPPGTVLDNAYTDRAKMIVVRSGAADAGRWVSESRDVYADYRTIVGDEPPRIAGVALMTDTDDTGERAVAWYGAITFRAAE